MLVQIEGSTKDAVPPNRDEKQSEQDVGMVSEDASQDKLRNLVLPTRRFESRRPVVDQRLYPERCSSQDDSNSPDTEEKAADADALPQDRYFATGEMVLAEGATSGA